MERMHFPSVAAAWAVLGLLLALAVAALPAGAQDTEEPPVFDLMGRVVDDVGNPLVGAFVAPTGSEWGSLTGEDGRFVLRKTTPGAVSLTVTLLGYDTLSWTGEVRESDFMVLSLNPQPLLLEGLNVVTSRFESRRRATAMSVRSFDQGELATAFDDNVLEFVATRAGLSRTPCNSAFGDLCYLIRGRVVVPQVWIDEAPVVGGMDYLRSFQPHDLYMVEVFGRGRQIRAYTQQFMERAAKTRLHPIPFGS